jgi:hypothetical protein
LQEVAEHLPLHDHLLDLQIGQAAAVPVDGHVPGLSSAIGSAIAAEDTHQGIANDPREHQQDDENRQHDFGIFAKISKRAGHFGFSFKSANSDSDSGPTESAGVQNARKASSEAARPRVARLDIRPGPQVIIDGSAVRGKARDSKWNGRKCNPNRD